MQSSEELVGGHAMLGSAQGSLCKYIPAFKLLFAHFLWFQMFFAL